jgi:hypothetical protein
MVNPPAPSAFVTARSALEKRGSLPGKWMQAISLPSGDMVGMELGWREIWVGSPPSMDIRQRVGYRPIPVVQSAKEAE